jgi:hypothetical protein
MHAHNSSLCSHQQLLTEANRHASCGGRHAAHMGARGVQRQLGKLVGARHCKGGACGSSARQGAPAHCRSRGRQAAGQRSPSDHAAEAVSAGDGLRRGCAGGCGKSAAAQLARGSRPVVGAGEGEGEAA